MAIFIYNDFQEWLALILIIVLAKQNLSTLVLIFILSTLRRWKALILLFVVIAASIFSVSFITYFSMTTRIPENSVSSVGNIVKSQFHTQNPIEIPEEEQEVQTYEEPKHGYQAGPQIISNEKSYYVSGRTREDLCKAILKWQEEEGMEETLAFINYKMTYSFYSIKTSKGYTVGDFKVTADSTITVPQWLSSDGASEGTKSDWRAFKNAAVSHEREHRDILIEYANKLVNELNAFGNYPTDKELKTAVEVKYNNIYFQLSSAQKKFDEEHGTSDSFSYLCR